LKQSFKINLNKTNQIMSEFLTGSNIVMLSLALFAIIILIKGFRIVKQSQVMVIERLGKFYKLLKPGVHIIIPLVDAPRPFLSKNGNTKDIDLREHVLDIDPQSVISKDNVVLIVDAILYYQIIDPIKASYEIANVTDSIGRLTQTTLRSVIGEMELDDTLASRDTINTRLQTVLDEASDPWGVKVTRVELSQIDPPKDIKNAMESELRAERQRRADVLEAEGFKRAEILKAEGKRDSLIAEAEGDKQAAIARAAGDAQATVLKADAEAKAVDVVNKAMKEGKDATDYFLQEKYIKAIEEIGKSGKQTVVLPAELTSFAKGLTKFIK